MMKEVLKGLFTPVVIRKIIVHGVIIPTSAVIIELALPHLIKKVIKYTKDNKKVTKEYADNLEEVEIVQ